MSGGVFLREGIISVVIGPPPAKKNACNHERDDGAKPKRATHPTGTTNGPGRVHERKDTGALRENRRVGGKNYAQISLFAEKEGTHHLNF